MFICPGVRVQEQARLTNLMPVDIDQISSPVDDEPIGYEPEFGSKLSTAAIGGVIGGLLVAVIAVVAALLLVRHKRNRRGGSWHSPAKDVYGGNVNTVRPLPIMHACIQHIGRR